MNYQQLHLNLLKYGRDNGFAYVCDSFRSRLRADPKYQQWKRLVSRVSLKAMTRRERYVLQSMLAVRMIRAVALANPNRFQN